MSRSMLRARGRMTVVFRILRFLFAVVLLGLGAAVSTGSAAAAEQDAVTARDAYDAWLGEVRVLYEKAKEAGEQVPGDVSAWFRDEIRKIGAWEYRVVELQDTFATELEGRFNELGRERWEVFWMEVADKRIRLFLKRPARSYLRNIPARDLLKLLPSPVPAPAE